MQQIIISMNCSHHKMPTAISFSAIMLSYSNRIMSPTQFYSVCCSTCTLIIDQHLNTYKYGCLLHTNAISLKSFGKTVCCFESLKNHVDQFGHSTESYVSLLYNLHRPCSIRSRIAFFPTATELNSTVDGGETYFEQANKLSNICGAMTSV